MQNKPSFFRKHGSTEKKEKNSSPVVKSITRRWALNSLGLIIVILVIAELAGAFFVRTYYYTAIRSSLYGQYMIETRAALMRYTSGTEEEFEEAARVVVENFSYKEQMEMMVIDRHGKVIATTSGFPVDDESMPDYEMALNNTVAYTGSWTGTSSSMENIMAVTTVLEGTYGNAGAVRLVISLKNVDRQIFFIVIIMLAVGVAILFFVMMSGSYFIKSIVTPVREVGQTARRIAMGDFDVRLKKKYNDEIGDLCDTINYMAGELGATEKMKNDFISSVSHELRTPLTAIKGWGETLMDPNTDPELIQRGMKVIVSETERLSGIVEELLDFSRIQSGRMTLRMDPIDILAELGEAVFMFGERARQEQKTLIYHEPQSLPMVMGDRDRLKQVFVNILDNALKYSDPGCTVQVDTKVNDRGFVQVIVSDNGCGISAEDLPKVKEKFYKGNTTRRGSGIGLAVVDEIVRLHNGTLEIESAEGAGTRVTISLPAAEGMAYTAPSLKGEE